MLNIAKRIVVAENSCHIWVGCVNTDGYPKISRNGDCNIKGHRYVYEQTKGLIPEGMVVRHTCDNILCLNPDHLVLGSPKDNVQDRMDRSRTHGQVQDGEIEAILLLQRGGYKQYSIARQLGIKPKRVEYIINKYLRPFMKG